MRILVLTFYFTPDLCAGSFRATPFVHELQKRSDKDDIIDVITTIPNRYGSFSENALNHEKNENVTIDRINLSSHKGGFVDQSILFSKFAWNVLKIVRKRKKYDIVYATSSRLMTAFLGALIANKQKSKLFLDIRDIFTDTLNSILIDSKLRYIIPLFRKLERYTINSASHINLVSQGFENHFRQINTKSPYSFYFNGIDDIFLKYNFSSLSNNKKKIITYAGNIGEGQGLEKIIPKIADFLGSSYEIHIIGDGGTKKKLVDSAKDCKNVSFYNPVNRESLLEKYKNSDYLFLHLNDYEAFKKVLPSKIFEYAVTNKMIIAGVGGFSANFIEKNLPDTILFEPCSIQSFIKQWELHNGEVVADRKKFIEKYNRENIMKNLVKKVYEL